MKKRLVLLMALSLTFAFPAAVMAEDTTAAEETADDTEAADSTAECCVLSAAKWRCYDP